MKKVLILSGLFLVVAVAIILFVGYRETKSHSPESTAVYEKGDLKISVAYNRPYKKGRVIFGGLVPYGKTWRTGANEPTVFRTSKALKINEKILPAGEYSLWTVPNEMSWQVVFNSTIPSWGIDVMNKGEAAREASTDVLVVEVPVMNSEKEFEQFNISVEEADDMIELILAWDHTLVSVPIEVSGQ